jgi:hypothetical protein
MYYIVHKLQNFKAIIYVFYNVGILYYTLAAMLGQLDFLNVFLLVTIL